jgi:hypothetical protein
MDGRGSRRKDWAWQVSRAWRSPRPLPEDAKGTEALPTRRMDPTEEGSDRRLRRRRRRRFFSIQGTRKETWAVGPQRGYVGEDGPGGYGGWVCERLVKKVRCFWQKRSPNCDFLYFIVLPPYPILKTYDGWVHCEG